MFTKTLFSANLLAASALLAPDLASAAATFATQFTFDSSVTSPTGPLVFDNGTIYGVTEYGGTGGGGGVGTLFKLNLSSQNFTVLYNYQDQNNVPFEPVYTVRNGANLYVASSGTDAAGGVGFISKFNVLNDKEATVYQFHSGDGQNPVGLVYVKGALYGVCQAGGGLKDGTVFSVNPKTGAETTIASLNGAGNGASPAAVVSMNGLLYGVAAQGGVSNAGTIFSTNPVTGNITVLYSFTGGDDGNDPTTLSAHDGVLYGTARSGGKDGDGVVFSFDTTTGTFKTLHQFTGKADGYIPLGGVTFFNGMLYGTTYYGVNNSQSVEPGTVFRLDASTGAGFHVIHSFTGMADGAFPQGPLVVQKGVLYGATSKSYFGPATIFTVTP